MNPILQALTRDPRIWRAGEPQRNSDRTHISSNIEALDRLLPGKGWPLAALSGLRLPHPGSVELRLLLPLMAQYTRQQQWVALIAPPHLPYAPGLEYHEVSLQHLLLIQPPTNQDILWSAEQCLRSSASAMTLFWPQTLNDPTVRRLQLAAETGGGIGVYVRSQQSQISSHTALQLDLQPSTWGLRVKVRKCRGAWPGDETLLPWNG